MAGRDSRDPEVWADKARVCSRNSLYRKIMTKRTSRCRPEAEVGHQALGQVGDKAALWVGDKAGDRISNLKKHPMPMLQSHRLSKTRQKTNRANNAETPKQNNRPAALSI
jgi:hypothetical protein